MALDEALLEVAAENPDSPPVLHFYRKTPSISLGYFQSVEEEVNIEACRQLGVGIFRRTSGGGAIYEDENQLIYGLVIPSPERYNVPSQTPESYRYINRGVIGALERFGLKAEFVPVNDIVVGGKKISGCAQTRRKGTLLQHGTLILSHRPEVMFRVLNVSPEKFRGRGLKRAEERVTSLEQTLGSAPPMAMVKEYLKKEFESALGIEFQPAKPTPQEREMQTRFVRERYGKEEWNFMR